MKVLAKIFGARQARVLRLCLDQLFAAPALEEMRTLPGRCHELTGDRKRQLSIDLVHPMRLIFEAADNPPPLKPDGGLDWNKVAAIRILGIEDTHD